MQLSQKCQYTLRALFELAKRGRSQPVSAAEIAQAQAIPARFLELILQGLRRAGQVEARRGLGGGYILAVPPDHLTVGQIIRQVEGSLAPVDCLSGDDEQCCRLKGRCAFATLWRRAETAMEQVLDATSLADLVEEDRVAVYLQHATDYSI